MTKYQAYPEYKDSGVEWLGEIPKKWEVSRVKHIAPFQVGWTPPTKNDANFIGENLWVNISDLKGKYISSTAKCISDVAAKEASMEITPKGSLLFSFKLSVGNVSFAECDLYTNEAIASFLGGAALPLEYLYYVLPKFIIENASTNIYGAKILNQELIKNSLLLVPDFQEATKIASFLDYETAKIDSLIEKQQQLIELLKEKRQAVISHAVTKGLNPDVPMKDSGVEWLGKVPEHWIIKKSKFLFEFVTSGSRGWSGYYSEEGRLFFRIANLTRDGVDPKLESIQFVNPPTGSEGERSIINNNDLLISITADLGSVCVANASIIGGYVSQHVALCRPNNLVISSRWLAYFIMSDSAKEQLLGAGYGGTKVQLSLEDIREFYVACPPEEEQLLIDDYLSIQLSRFEKLDNEADKQISLLQERRTALISAAVTGKIDLRNWVAPAASEAAADTASQEVNV